MKLELGTTTSAETDISKTVPEFAENTEEVLLPYDCSDIDPSQPRTSGLYEVRPAGGNQSFQVYCDMDTDGGNWTVFQRRIDGTENFNRPWIDYKTGFGNLTSEHWLGNDKIHLMMSQRNYELRIDLMDEAGSTRYAKYKAFRIANETMNYRLHIRGYSGNAGDSMNLHNGRDFSTWDNDNDIYRFNCAAIFHSGWWFNRCLYANLNGVYKSGEKTVSEVIWSSWKGNSMHSHNGRDFSTWDNDNDIYRFNCAANFRSGWWFNRCIQSNLNGLYKLGKKTMYGTIWSSWKGLSTSMKGTEMKIRPVS
ncbi:microfibril-associated glycoprotein 4-like [Diadema antillarum]|uniref:microfibril-associated glycoprotein 4-like n=1 Tax=Diadema antillarum TaxID=105358 RepID=UPI003A8B6B1D